MSTIQRYKKKVNKLWILSLFLLIGCFRYAFNRHSWNLIEYRGLKQVFKGLFIVPFLIFLLKIYIFCLFWSSEIWLTCENIILLLLEVYLIFTFKFWPNIFWSYIISIYFSLSKIVFCHGIYSIVFSLTKIQDILPKIL